VPRSTDTRGLPRLALALVAALAITACNQVNAATPTVRPEDAAVLNQPSQFPVGQEWRLSQAWSSPARYYESSYELFQTATQVCMRDKGFEYQVVAYPFDDLFFTRINPLKTAAAERFGYHVPDIDPGDPNADRGSAFREALASADGCGNAAFAFVYEGPAASRFSTQLDALVQSATNAVDGFSATKISEQLIQKWSTCMRTRGYEYANPEEPLLRYSDGALSSTEVATRLADLACDAEVGLTRARSEYEQGRLDRWLEANAEQIESVIAATAAAQVEAEQRSLDLTERGVAALRPS